MRPQVTLTPDQAMSQAAALYSAGRVAEAAQLCEAILRADPGHFWALHLGASIALRNGDFDRCIALATRALERDPRHVEVLCNRGAAYRRSNRFEAALADYERALALDPRLAVAYNNRGVALQALNRHGEAIESFDRALALRPDDLNAKLHRALSRLVTGDLERGLDDYEARYGGGDLQTPRRETSVPQWTGAEPLEGRTILVHAEQGLGDSIQFVRYATLLRDRGARVILEVPAALRALLAGVEGVAQAFLPGETLPSHDFHIPMLSLARAFGTRLDTIPAAVPYLAADPARVDAWRGRLGNAKAPRIGIAWSGNPGHINDRNRSMPLALLSPLATLEATIVAVQKDLRPGDAATLGRLGWAHFGAELQDFRDTAALVEALDLVVTVDTSIAHLAGALARPAWVMLPFSPDWRFLLEREDSTWYPTLRLFRQPAVDDWAAVVARVVAEAGARR